MTASYAATRDPEEPQRVVPRAQARVVTDSYLHDIVCTARTVLIHGRIRGGAQSGFHP